MRVGDASSVLSRQASGSINFSRNTSSVFKQSVTLLWCVFAECSSGATASPQQPSDFYFSLGCDFLFPWKAFNKPEKSSSFHSEIWIRCINISLPITMCTLEHVYYCFHALYSKCSVCCTGSHCTETNVSFLVVALVLWLIITLILPPIFNFDILQKKLISVASVCKQMQFFEWQPQSSEIWKIEFQHNGPLR